MAESLLSEMEKGKWGNLENDAKLLFSMELQQVQNLSSGVSKKSKVESQNYIISIRPIQGRILGIVL